MPVLLVQLNKRICIYLCLTAHHVDKFGQLSLPSTTLDNT